MALCQHRHFQLHDQPLAPKLQSCRFDLNLPELERGAIGLATGVGISYKGAEARARLLSHYAGGCNIHIVHDPSHGWIPDLAKAGLNLLGFVTNHPILQIHQVWAQFFARNPNPNVRFLQFCHSKGTLYVRRALHRLTPLERSRIEIVSIAGAAYIPAHLCYRVSHYASTRDIVPLLDPSGRKRSASTTILLRPHLDAPLFDHTFYSPTYQPLIQHHLRTYLAETKLIH